MDTWLAIRARIGRRGAFLLCLAAVQILIGWSILDAPPKQFDVLTVFRDLTQPGVGWFWIGSGILAGAFAFAPADRDALGFLFGYISPTVFGVLYAISWWPLHELPAGMAVRAAALYWGYALLIVVASGWNEPHSVVRVVSEKRDE